jgi:hypothetical protein
MDRRTKRRILRQHQLSSPEKTAQVGAVFNLSSALTPSKDDKGLTKLLFNGYNGGPVDLRDYWLEHPMYYNIEGISYKNSIPILHEHRTPIGHTTTITKNSESISGEGIASYPSASREEVIAALDNGFPFQASMGLHVPDAESISFLAKGEKRVVNNRSITGPAYIAEKSVMKEMTVTMSGRDDSTEFNLLNEAAISMLRNSAPTPGSPTPPTPPVAPPTDVKNEAPTPAPVPPAAPAPAPTHNNSMILTFALSKLIAKYPDHEEMIENGLKANKDLQTIENSIKLSMFENGLSTAPKMTGDRSESTQNTILAHFALACGIQPATLEKFGIEKKLIDVANSAPSWGWLETLTNIANSNEGQRRFSGFSDISILCNSLKNQNRQTFFQNSAFSTVDMPNLLKKVTEMQMLERWTINEPFAVRFLAEESNNDFRVTQRIRPTGGEIWNQLKPDGKIEHTHFGSETEYRSSLDTVAQLVVFNREHIYNDNMGVIASMLDAMVEGAMIVPDMKLGKKMLVQAAAANTFWVNSTNSFTSTALNTTNLAARYNAARQYNENRGKNYVTLINDRWTVITSITGEETAWNILKQDRIVNDTTANTKTGDKNYWYNKMDMAVFPQMSNSSLLGSGTFVSEATWLLWPASKKFSPYTITYLRNQKKPTIETVDLPENMLGFGTRGFWDVEINEREKEAVVRANG